MRHCQSLSSSWRKRVASSVAWKRFASPAAGASGDRGAAGGWACASARWAHSASRARPAGRRIVAANG